MRARALLLTPPSCPYSGIGPELPPTCDFQTRILGGLGARARGGRPACGRAFPLFGTRFRSADQAPGPAPVAAPSGVGSEA